MEENCVFCKIVNGKLPSTKLYEDDEILAFEDIDPIAPVHVLIIPKRHIESIEKMQKEDEALIGRIFSVIKKIAEEKGVAQKGYRIVTNIGEDGGQAVKHLHFHLLGGKKLRTR